MHIHMCIMMVVLNVELLVSSLWFTAYHLISILPSPQTEVLTGKVALIIAILLLHKGKRAIVNCFHQRETVAS